MHQFPEHISKGAQPVVLDNNSLVKCFQALLSIFFQGKGTIPKLMSEFSHGLGDFVLCLSVLSATSSSSVQLVASSVTGYWRLAVPILQ